MVGIFDGQYIQSSKNAELYKKLQEKMTMDGLRKAIRILLENTEKYLDEYVPNSENMSEKELIEYILNDVVSDDMLNYINEHMKLQPTTQLTVFDDDVTATVVNDQMMIGHDIQLINLLFDEPVCYVGYFPQGTGISTYYYSNNIMAFLTITGEWRFAECKTIYDAIDEEKQTFYLEIYTKTEKRIHTLNELEQFIKEDYRDLLVCEP